jgi:predicted PurR-regulated permease PerM
MLALGGIGELRKEHGAESKQLPGVRQVNGGPRLSVVRPSNGDQMDTVVAAPASNGGSRAPNGTGVKTVPPGAGMATPARLATTARVVFLILALLAFAHLARAVVLPMLLACVASMTLKAPVRWLRQCHIPTPLAAGVVVGVFVAGITLGIMHLGRPAVEWLAAAPENLPRLKAKFQHVLRPAVRWSKAASSVGNLAGGDKPKETPPVEVNDQRVASTVFTWTGSLLAGAGETVVLLFLLLASGDLFLQKLVRVMPKLHDKKQAVEISREIQLSISTYLFSVSLINLGVGVVVGLALHLLGIPNALMWGGVAAFANFIPYIGPILGITAVGLAGLLTFDTLGRALLPAGTYCLLHLVEANLLTPFVLGRRCALNPVLIFVGLISCVWLWGVVGAFLAVPLLVTLKVICDRVPELNFLGEFLAPHDTPEPAQAGFPSQPVDPAPIVSMPHIP